MYGNTYVAFRTEYNATMTNVAFIIYRAWGYRIFENLKAFEKTHPFFSINTIITTPECEFDRSTTYSGTRIFEVEGKDNEKIHKILIKQKVTIACFYGWSWIVREPILSGYICLCLHPSPLPKYRGGTPLQHQIIHGEKHSAVTVIRMSKGIDDGDIYMQRPISLQGDILDIFKRIVTRGSEITQRFFVDYGNNTVRFTPQKNLDANPPLKRRRPEDGVFTLEQLSTFPYEHLFNCVRALTAPYPNVIINTGRTRMSVSSIRRYHRLPSKSLLIDNNTTSEDLRQKSIPVFVQVKNAFAKLDSYEALIYQ